MRMTEKKVTRQPRLTLKRGTTNGIFSNGIQANPVVESDPHHRINVPIRNPSPSTSSIYLASIPVSVSNSSDYEKDLFRTPENLEMAKYHHQCDLERCDDDWFDNTANFTQSQRQGGFIQRHGGYYHFNSQR